MQKTLLIILALACAALACNFPGLAAWPVPTSPPPLSPSAEAAPSASFPALEPSPTPQPIPSEPPSVVSIPPDADPCTLISVEKAEVFLGQAVSVNANSPGVCMFLVEMGDRSLTVTLQSGEAAKLGYLDVIAQFQDDCNLSFQGGTDITPTPLPPEILALSSKSLLELAGMAVDGYARCGTVENFSLTEPQIGELSFINVWDLLFVQSAQLTVVSGEVNATFTFAAQGMEKVQAQKGALVDLVAEAFAP